MEIFHVEDCDLRGIICTLFFHKKLYSIAIKIKVARGNIQDNLGFLWKKLYKIIQYYNEYCIAMPNDACQSF